MAPTRPATILVLVSDADVRELIRHILVRSEHRVLIAADEAHASRLARSGEIDVLLVEVAPAVDGRSIAERIRAAAPGLPVLFVTGWFDHPHFAGLEDEPIVKAPFSRKELARAIDAVVRGERGQ